MATIIRGTLWFGLYVFLALLPLGTAIAANPNRTDPPLLLGLAIGAGFVGLSLMALEFALISRVTPAAGAFGGKHGLRWWGRTAPGPPRRRQGARGPNAPDCLQIFGSAPKFLANAAGSLEGANCGAKCSGRNGAGAPE